MLASGTRLGPYEIVAPLGAGGMGEVYRARDTRLARDVAVKVMPQHLTREPEARARFEREARSISSLNHPHICVLHDVGREGDTDYLVMELVEGETLSARLAKGALPLADVLRLGSQVADALARAHRAGVVHRDLKPGNIMVTKSGAKLMDFGLARSSRSASIPPQEATQAPTETSPITGEGRILGTVPYMAPEQLEGREADARSDIWALGCVLYEMATGTRAFGGSSTASVMSAILRDEPAPLAERAPASPPALERLIRSCLAKDANDRWQSAGDLARELGWMAGGGEVTNIGASMRRGVGAWVALTALVMAAVVAALQLTGRAPWSGLIRSTWVMVGSSAGPGPIPQHTTYALSPDGRMIAFTRPDTAGTSRLYLRRLDGPDAIPLAPRESAQQPFWSPDSREVAFLNGEGSVERVRVDGGEPQLVCKAGFYLGASWSSAGWILYGSPSGAIMKVRAGGGTPEPALSLDSTRHETGQIFPEFLPDGRHFLFVSYPALGVSRFSVRVGAPDGRASGTLFEIQGAPQCDRSGHVVYMRSHVLYAQSIAPDGSRLLGEPVPLREAPARQAPFYAAPVASVGGSSLLFAPADVRPTEFVWWGRRGERLERVGTVDGFCIGAEVSPDGSRLVTREVYGMESTLWLLELSSGRRRRLTAPGARNTFQLWSATGDRIGYFSTQAGRDQARSLDPDASDSVRVIADNEVLVRFAPGDFVALMEHDSSDSSGTNSDLYIKDLWSSSPEQPWAASKANEAGAAFFDGGHRLAYLSDESGRNEVYCDYFPGRRHATQLTSNGASSDDDIWVLNDELIYVTADRQSVHSIPLRQTAEGVAPGPDRLLFDLPRGAHGVWPSRDSQRFMIALPAGPGPSVGLTLVQDWAADLKRR